MVDKLLLNNQLLANKKKVQKAKIMAINKLVQKIRKLKSLAEKKPENKKFNEKILRNTEILSCAKKLKNMEILKKALLNDTNPNTIITNGRSLPEEIAEAILFVTKPIIEIVKNIKDLLSLNDEINPGWKNKILELSKKKQKQLRTEQKKEIRHQRKERHQLTLKRTEWLEENLPENMLKDDSPVEVMELDKVALEFKLPKNKEKKIKLQEKLKQELIVETDKVTLECKPSKNKEKKNIKLQEKFKEKPQQELLKIEENDYNSEAELEVVKSIDPFFITQSGDNYLSTVIIDRVQTNTPNDGMVRKDRRAYQNKGDRKQIRKNNFNNSKNNSSTFKMQTLENNNKWKNGNNIHTKIETNETEEKLHPSWACKQKERGIKEFSGKKIVFDEFETTITKANDNIENKIHPSWEAKQKQKGIKNFAGKKTTFDDLDNNSKNNDTKLIIKSEEKLHPSWVAKQKLKPVISEFKGKKIKFDD